jgi:Holliday junction resolvase RusA-like endonuclease
MGEATLELFDDGPAALVVGPVFLCFELRGKPGHKGRHRSRVVIPKEAWSYGGRGPKDRWINEIGAKRIYIHNYPDPETEAYEKVLAEAGALFMRGKAPTLRPVALLVHSFRQVPESWSKADKRAALRGAILPTPRPDWDNYGKITDALNEIVWKDDSQVCDGRVIKRYSDAPALRVEVREFVPPEENR